MLLLGVAAVALAIVGWERAGGVGWDVAAGACAVLAAGFKPSPPCSCRSSCSARRRRLPALRGAGGAGALVADVVALVYGGRLPATGIQDGLVAPLSVPNVIAALHRSRAALTAGGRAVAHAVAGAGRGRRRRGRRVARERGCRAPPGS